MQRIRFSGNPRLLPENGDPLGVVKNGGDKKNVSISMGFRSNMPIANIIYSVDERSISFANVPSWEKMKYSVPAIVVLIKLLICITSQTNKICELNMAKLDAF